MPYLIIAIGRGGFVPGRFVCNFLPLNDITSMKIEHYKRAALLQHKTCSPYVPDYYAQKIKQMALDYLSLGPL